MEGAVPLSSLKPFFDTARFSGFLLCRCDHLTDYC